MDGIRVYVPHVMAIYLHVGVFKNVPGTDSLFWLFVEKFLKEDTRCLAHMIWKLKLVVPNGVVKLLIVSTLEREFSAKQSV